MTALLNRVRCLQPDRIIGVDVARCVALVGMMGTHIVDDYSTKHPNSYSWVHVVFAGKASALFCLLAGISLTITSWREGTVRPGAEYSIAVRAALIALLGLTLELAEASIAIILVNYAVLFVLGMCLLRLPTVALGIAVSCWWLIGPITSYAIRSYPEVPAPTYQVTSWLSLADPTTLGWELMFTGYYPAWTWVAFLMTGMLIGRMDIRSSQVAWRLFLGGASIAFGAWGLSKALVAKIEVNTVLAFPPDLELFGFMTPEHVLQSGAYGAVPTTSWWWLVTSAPHSGTPPEVLGATGTAVAVVGACLLGARAATHRMGTWLMWPLAAAGSMPLTLYSLHVVLLGRSSGFPGEGAAWINIGSWPWTAQSVVFVVAAAAWSLTGLRGPLEMVLSGSARAARRIGRPSTASPQP